MAEAGGLRGAGIARAEARAELAGERDPVVVAKSPSPADRERWNGFVLGHPEGTFFHLVEWAQVLERAFGHRSRYLYAEADGRIVGVLPLVEVKSLLFGHALVSTPFCVYGGCVTSDEGVCRTLERAARELGERLGVDYIEMRNRRPRHPGWLPKDLYVTFRRPITADPEENMRAIPRKQRAMVRKAISRGLDTTLDPTCNDLYAMYSESLRNLGTPVFGKRYLQTLLETFGESCEILTVRSDGEPVASVLSFYFRDEVLPYYGGGTSRARELAANDFMYWSTMQRAAARGARLFDYGRSKTGSGSFNFKVNWGFEPLPLCYEYWLVRARQMPNLSPSNSKYKLLIDSWKRLPTVATRVLGPPIAKYLG
jgi:FemAB-related protein (PEP-CTERM system-associated)